MIRYTCERHTIRQTSRWIWRRQISTVKTLQMHFISWIVNQSEISKVFCETFVLITVLETRLVLDVCVLQLLEYSRMTSQLALNLIARRAIAPYIDVLKVWIFNMHVVTSNKTDPHRSIHYKRDIYVCVCSC